MRIFAGAVLLVAVCGTAIAQDAETTTPKPAEPSLTVDVPPGGCMPFGVTAAGDLVFPIQCKELIERRRGAGVQDKATVPEQKPAELAKQQPDIARVESATPETSPVPLPREKPTVHRTVRKPAESRRVEEDRRRRATRRYYPGPPGLYEDETGALYLGR
jgi:hypothetical protein